MATASLLLPHHYPFPSLLLNPTNPLKPQKQVNLLKASINEDPNSSNGAIESPKQSRRGRKKKTPSPASPSPSSSSTRVANWKKKTPSHASPSPSSSSTKVANRKKKSEQENNTPPADLDDDELEDYDDGVDSYEYPPLVCCFGSVKKEFVPTVRVHDNQMHPDIYSEWKMLQWDPPEFARTPGGPPSNVAISHVRLGGRAAFMGKVGDDCFGEELVLKLNVEKVQTRGVQFDEDVKTACSRMKVKFDEDGKMRMEMVKEAAEDSLLGSELNLSVLKEARMLHFNSEVLTSPSMETTLYRAIKWSRKFGGLVFFDLNLPLPFWKSRGEAKETIKKAWNEADFIEVSRTELEFLLDEDYYERRKNYKHQYISETYEKTKKRRDCYHYTREEIAPLWHDKLKLLFVTDGTIRIHYYGPSFDGVIVGTEDVLITPFTCDRTGSGDAIVAAIMRKLTTCPEMVENQDTLERQLRFAVAAGIISQWTIGAVRGFPTESATQNLKEQVYVPSMW